MFWRNPRKLVDFEADSVTESVRHHSFCICENQIRSFGCFFMTAKKNGMIHAVNDLQRRADRPSSIYPRYTVPMANKPGMKELDSRYR